MKIILLGVAMIALSGCPALTPHDMLEARMKEPHCLPGFAESHHWNEQISEYLFEPNARIHINAPSKNSLDVNKPTELILYALPNGNSIEWTVGRQKSEDLDWHYFIQHIGAQTRRLREIMTDRNIVVAYLEANPKSWPSWRKANENSGELILKLVDDIKQKVSMPDTSLTLSSHSGGGSFIFGYINAVEEIPSEVHKICFLDSNYGFSAEDGHGDKLLRWLNEDEKNVLAVLAYDDREITFQGKKVVGPTGGTYRASHRMIDFFTEKIYLNRQEEGDLIEVDGLDGRLDMIIHKNPENKILHTVLVGDMSGFIHTILLGTRYEDRAVFNGPVTYEKWIQP